MPVSAMDKQSPRYRKGVSCPHCHERRDDDRAARFAERQRQIDLARERGEAHIGQEMETLMRERREAKLRFKDGQRRSEAGNEE